MDNICIFCTFHSKSVIENTSAYVIFDKYPVTKFHSLIIPKRHTVSFFELSDSEKQDCLELLSKIKNQIYATDPSISGFNVGINDGIDAGQTISHSHIHLIPRRKHDVKSPKGGIRHVIPGKGYYEKISLSTI